jgi:hypothetical protein
LCGNAAFASNRDAASRLRLGTPRAWRALPWGLQSSLARGSAIVCLGRDAAPPGSDLCGNAASASNRDAASRLRLGTPRAWRALPWELRSALARGSAIVCLGRDAAPPGSDLCGNAAFKETVVSEGLYSGLAALSAG